MIEVWHAITPTFGYGDAPAWPSAYVKVAEVETDDIDAAYTLTNHIDRAWFDNPGVRAFGAPKLRSTSVGDVMVRNGVAYRCADVGWELAAPAVEAPDTHGVIVLNGTRCVFASALMTRTEAEAAAAKMEGGELVDADMLRAWKQVMVGGRR